MKATTGERIAATVYYLKEGEIYAGDVSKRVALAAAIDAAIAGAVEAERKRCMAEIAAREGEDDDAARKEAGL